ncbi:TNF receptor-associated factor 3-like [Amyelois transitella]|uniref:TNF receptor-associated factor 3-like n=1 Tax=Amyelois transitella TaxID=680683 RepID=UPI0029906BA1|nr:TNF receptor-associated factor 3-like [Amyelois transitella]XP_060806485.1 TNF receptor-associated factor 3-like [Amyelois transitella]XP_060806486.1 TNF receptor-associated factor 3-like [Amyelois transitella]XP_060806487.1 TNF receptor-associated factor 3-like [Amyelois transitella]XP_060806488.1 TNF receptor-associated factor 3-like [Amyelois transitella]XP_060806489.1 TNF receptor-associated factor 3-like [Amyelois transitella]XP_060806490.1 TNF receptor-associated factor 3-like [Amyel
MSVPRKNGTLNQKEIKGVKDSPCYFCNELFEMGKLQNHLKECGSILEQCPLRCGAWIQRKHRDTHTKDCPQLEKNRKSSTYDSTWSPEPPHTWVPQAPHLDDRIGRLEKEVDAIKLALAEESSQRDIHQTELQNLRSKMVLMEERSQHFLSTLVSTRATMDDEQERTSNWASQFKHDLANVQLAIQDLQNEQLNTAMRLESATNQLVNEQHERELLEQALTHHDNRIRAVNKLEDVINYIRQTVEAERERNLESRAVLEAELMEARRSSQQLTQLTMVREQLQTTEIERPALDRLAILEVATADARAESQEHSAKMDIIMRDMRALTKSYHKLRSELADFQTRVSFERFETGSDDGHFLWRIDQFTSRMKDAKEKDTVITSPYFRTTKYGYTVKAEVNLNGIGRWKGRHITCTVRLVGGSYDSLLEWPCDLTVNIALKDQPNNRSQAMDIVKSLQVRRKTSPSQDYETEDERTKSTEALDKSVVQLKRQYVFFPHTSLDKLEYVKNDTMFLEFTVLQ